MTERLLRVLYRVVSRAVLDVDDYFDCLQECFFALVRGMRQHAEAHSAARVESFVNVSVRNGVKDFMKRRRLYGRRFSQWPAVTGAEDTAFDVADPASRQGFDRVDAFDQLDHARRLGVVRSQCVYCRNLCSSSSIRYCDDHLAERREQQRWRRCGGARRTLMRARAN